MTQTLAYRQAHAPRSPLVAFLCFLIAILEGFDLQVAGIAAPNLKLQFALDPATLGWFFSASTIGLLIGALVGGHLSDRIGRERVLLWSVAGFGAASIITGLSQSPAMLIGARIATGLGLGGALPNLLAFTSEHAAPGRERRAVALLYCGVPVGGASVSLIGAALGTDWRTPFVIGGLLPLLLAALLWRVMPPGQAPALAREEPQGIAEALFGQGRLIASLLIWTSFFATLIILYLVLNWLPTLLTGLGLSRQTSFLAQLAFNCGGLVLCAVTAPLLDLRRGWLVALAAFTAIPILLLRASAIEDAGAAILFAFLLGGAVLVTQSYLYALAPRLYPASSRGVGVGAAVAAGRIGSIAGPLLGALLVASGGGMGAVLRGIIPVALVAGAAAIILSLRQLRS
ncbi:MFS transporter [Sphingobium sp. PNB]|uniref:MFS transporter n=1 Tax=Sphingobium sp. PNB TaxID=863934 RepID=UPI001CA3FF5B|nr:MFS transporter [Sphingobium sp. PNB]MCB4860972.1 MFS transporter [Sphingobium sp. PNB]